MALPTVSDCKLYLRKEDTSEDTLLAQLLTRAQAAIETCVGYPMTAAALTYVGYDQRFTTSELQLPGPFLATGPAPIVTDVDGAVVDATTYVLDNRNGLIRSKYEDFIFGAMPYTVVATVGLSAHPDYAARLEAIAALAIVDMVAHLYQNRNPAIASESDEGGGSVSLSPEPIPQRIRQDLLLLPCTRGLVLA